MATKKFDDPYNSSNISQMAAKFTLHMCHLHVLDRISFI